MSALYFVLGLPLVPFWGVWADKYSRKAVIARSAFVEMVVFAGVALSQNRYQLLLPALLVGFQLGNTGVMLSALRAVAPVRRLGLAISLFAVTPPLGIALGPALGGLLVDHRVLDLHGLYMLDAVLSLGAGVMLLVLYREARPQRVPTESAVRLALRAVRLVVTTRVTLGLFAVFAMSALASNVAGPFFPLVVQRLHHETAGLATAIGIVFGASSLLGALLSPLAGWIGDRVGFRRVLVAGAALVGLSLAAMAVAPNLPLLTLAAVAFGTAVASSSSMIFALLATVIPEDRRTTTLNLALCAALLRRHHRGLARRIDREPRPQPRPAGRRAVRPAGGAAGVAGKDPASRITARSGAEHWAT